MLGFWALKNKENPPAKKESKIRVRPVIIKLSDFRNQQFKPDAENAEAPFHPEKQGPEEELRWPDSRESIRRFARIA